MGIADVEDVDGLFAGQDQKAFSVRGEMRVGDGFGKLLLVEFAARQ